MAEIEVLVFGSAIVDFICYVDRLPKPGETLHGNKFATGFGGKGANQCVAAAKLGASTAMVAKLGNDPWGTKYVENLQKQGVNVDFVEICNNETTGIAQICVAGNGENNIVIVAGANNQLNQDDINKARQLFVKSKVLICQLETPLKATLTALQTFKGISILNAAPAMSDTPLELLKTASIFCVNETEAALMVACPEIATIEQSKQAILKLLHMGANCVIITLGALGAVYGLQINSEIIHVPTQKIEKVVDTTGAGDAFIGSLAYFMAKFPNKPMHQQIGGANEVASYSVKFEGTQSSFPNKNQIDIDLNVKQYNWHKL